MMGTPHTLVGGSAPVFEAIAALPHDDLLVFRVTPICVNDPWEQWMQSRSKI